MNDGPLSYAEFYDSLQSSVEVTSWRLVRALSEILSRSDDPAHFGGLEKAKRLLSATYSLDSLKLAAELFEKENPWVNIYGENEPIEGQLTYAGEGLKLVKEDGEVKKFANLKFFTKGLQRDNAFWVTVRRAPAIALMKIPDPGASSIVLFAQYDPDLDELLQEAIPATRPNKHYDLKKIVEYTHNRFPYKEVQEPLLSQEARGVPLGKILKSGMAQCRHHAGFLFALSSTHGYFTRPVLSQKHAHVRYNPEIADVDMTLDATWNFAVETSQLATELKKSYGTTEHHLAEKPYVFMPHFLERQPRALTLPRKWRLE